MILDRIPVRFRLSLGHGIWMAIIFTSVGYGLFRLVRSQLFDAVDAALLASASSVRDIRHLRGGPPRLDSYLEQFFGDRLIRPYAQLVNLSGKVNAKTANVQVRLPVTPRAVGRAERGLETFETFNIDGKLLIRQVTLPVFHKGGFTGELIQIASPLDATVHTLKGISLMLWTALPAGIFVSIIFGYLLTARAFRPVSDMQRSAQKLSIEDLSQRLEVPYARDELQELAISYNNMLDRLEEAVNRLRRFVGDVSHELRTPLAVIRAEAQLTIRRPRSPEEYKESLNRVVRESKQMTSIIEDLLLLARAQSKSVAMNWMDVESKNFVEELKTSVEPIFESRNVKLIIDNQCQSSFFQASSTYLNLSLKNILLNASKHSSPESEVKFEIWQDYQSTHFSVEDFGEGIPEDAINYIFDPFFRVDSARNRAGGGTGIGLALAMALVKLHNGDIKVQSQKGKGSKFIVSIPTKNKTS